MDELKKQLLDKLKSSNNILVTVGRDPSVDQLSALLGLTLFLNKQGKHAAAVFSGEVPPALEFLKPEETIEKDTNSLRDFIIALDKTKADKLRYKVEDDVVRIFITPYKTSISQDDFEFSQGDFNVDLVVAVGVQQQEDLDEAIVAHGRILHDATVASINVTQEGGIGTINWHMPGASSLSELVSDIAQSLDKNLLDEQIATAILTGIVAETDRFSNEKTTAQTMSASAVLMAAGANQQLVASKLQEPDGGFGGVDNAQGDQQEGQPETETPGSNTDDGTLEINHRDSEAETPALELPEPDENAPLPDESDENEEPKPEESSDEVDNPSSGLGLSEGSSLITEPPTLGGTLTSNTHQETLDPSTDPFSMPTAEDSKILSRKDPMASFSSEPEESAKSEESQPLEPPLPSAPAPGSAFQPAPMPPPSVQPEPVAQSDDSQYSTLADLEESIGSPHAGTGSPSTPPPTGSPSITGGTNPAPTATDDTSDLNAARDEVSRALTEATASGNISPGPIQALNAQPMTEGLHSEATPPAAPAPDAFQQNAPQVIDPTAPPPVPPPIPFQFGQQPPKQ